MATQPKRNPLATQKWPANWLACVRVCGGFEATTRHVAAVYSEHADYDTGANVKPSMARVAWLTGYAESTCYEHRAKLEARGWLTPTKDHRRGVVPTYTLTFPSGLLWAATFGGRRRELEDRLRESESGSPHREDNLGSDLCNTTALDEEDQNEESIDVRNFLTEGGWLRRPEVARL
jgi:hypothetical protein